MDRRHTPEGAQTPVTAEVALRTVMACFPTGVTVVATRDADGRPVGMTVNSFTSVSLEPPLVLVCINKSARSHDPLVEGEGFTISILAGAQADVASRFATHPFRERFDDVEWHDSPSGNPVLAGSVAWLDCAVHEVVSAGDHSIVLGRAVAAGSTGKPSLLFHRGAFGSIGE